MTTLIDLLLQSSWQIIILALVVWPLSRLSIRSHPNFAYLLWVVVLVKSLIPITVTLPMGEQALLVMPPILSGQFLETDMLSNTHSHTLQNIVLGVWFAGALIIALRLLLSEVGHRREMRTAVLLPEESWFQDLKQEIGVLRAVRLFSHESIRSPLMQGLFRPRVYLPMTFADWSLEAKRSVLAHELTHIKRWDILIIYLQALVRSIYFFHPVIWLVNDQIDLEREKICDDEAIQVSRSERAIYGDQLFQQLSQENEGKTVPVLAGGFFMSDSSLIKRFRYIKEKRGTMNNKLRPYHFMLISLVASLAVFIACTNGEDPTLMDPPGLTKETTEPGFVAFDSAPSPIGGYAAVQGNVIYPELAREAGIEGTTIVQIIVNTEGEAVHPEVLRSSGNTSLDNAAANAATVTSWNPAMKDGVPVRVKIAIPVVFRLQSEPADGAGKTDKGIDK